MSLEDRHANEILTDNSAEKHYEQCKDCAYQDGGDVWSNNYKKGNCLKYPHIDSSRYNGKPHGVYTGKEKCKYYKKKD